MNLITKLLMENEIDFKFVFPKTTSNGRTDLEVIIKDIDCMNAVKYSNRKELLSEVPEQFYVNELEWMLLNYWQENDIKQISADKSGNLTLWHGPDNSDYDEFYMNWATNKLFQFLEVNKFYALSNLINRCALIEG